MKYFTFDVETTGLSPFRNTIWQVGYIISENEKVLERGQFRMNPNPDKAIDPRALEVSNMTEKQLKVYDPHTTVYEQILRILDGYVNKFDKNDKMILVGYNNLSFDNQFFRGFFYDCGNKFFGSYFWSGGIDVLSCALSMLTEQRKDMENFKLGTVATQLGLSVKEESLHDAMYDVDLTFDIFKMYMKALRKF